MENDFIKLPRKEWEELEYWLDRCYDKGHLERCSDLIGPLEALNKAIIDLKYPKEKIAGYQVWWGVGEMRPYGKLFKERAEADEYAAWMKSNTEVRALYYKV